MPLSEGFFIAAKALKRFKNCNPSKPNKKSINALTAIFFLTKRHCYTIV